MHYDQVSKLVIAESLEASLMTEAGVQDFTHSAHRPNITSWPVLASYLGLRSLCAWNSVDVFPFLMELLLESQLSLGPVQSTQPRLSYPDATYRMTYRKIKSIFCRPPFFICPGP